MLFGATWLVNSLVFAAILISVLLANLTANRWQTARPWTLLGPLLGSLVIAYVVPLESFLAIPSPPVRYVVASALFFAPIFFANLLFSALFRRTHQAGTAFGWNVVGAMLGGTAEYTSLAFGYRALTVVVAALYLGAYLWAGGRGEPASKGT